MLNAEAIAYQQFCPRRRFLGFEYQNVGLEPVKAKLSYAVESAVRDGLWSWFMYRKMANAVLKAEARFGAKTAGGADLGPNEDWSKISEEQTALCGAIVRNYIELNQKEIPCLYPGPVPALDLDTIKIGGAWPDAVQDINGWRATFFRVVVGSYDIDTYQDRHRIVSSVINVERTVKAPVSVHVVYLLKGRRTDRGQHSPLIRGYRKGTAHRFEFAPGWDVLNTWKDPGTSTWLAALPTSVRLEQIRRVTDETDFSLIQMLSSEGKAEWLKQIQAQESRIEELKHPPIMFDKIDLALFPGKLTPGQMMIEPIGMIEPRPVDALWPQYRHSCKYCEFPAVCDQRIANPEQSGLYRLKA